MVKRHDVRRRSERRRVARVASDRRCADRRAGARVGLAMTAFTMMSTPARPDIYTRTNSRGVVEATNIPANPKDFKLAYRSKGTLVHSAGFRLRPSTNREFDGHIDAAAVLHGVSRQLIRAIIQAESGFDRLAVSTAGARGLMQLMPDTAIRFGVSDSFDARQNILGGTRYLRWLLDLYRGDVSLSAAAYNAGESAVARYNGIPPYRETQSYVRKVNAILGTATPAETAVVPAMFYTPGNGTEPRRDAPPTAAPAAKRRPRFFYRWTDAKGVAHMTEAPPAAGEYTIIRSLD